MTKNIYDESLVYHLQDPKGKLCITATKPLSNPHDLSLAYSPGVAAPCQEIVKDPQNARKYTSKGNLVAVISNGTAVLGLGNIGALASKPVMEGKAVLFKKFSNLDAFDIEIDETDPDKLIDIIASLEPTFGGINLEDIKAPECFYIEQKLRERMNIPVIHDDQHGTAIVVAAALKNALILQDKAIENIKAVVNGAGASAVACMKLLLKFGLKKENLYVVDRHGVIYKGRDHIDATKEEFIRDTPLRTLTEAIKGADFFLGLSAPKVLTSEHVKTMAKKPIVFALANPEPEIYPDEVYKEASDAIVATGRSDFPNQVNNAICFPYIFRGAIDAGATIINDEIIFAATEAIAKIGRSESSLEVSASYGEDSFHFGPQCIIPKPLDRRLIVEISAAVAKAAVDSGVASNKIENWHAYHQKLNEMVYRSGYLMRPVFNKIQQQTTKKRLTFAEGEDYRVLEVVQTLIDDNIATPILVGRPDIIAARHKKLNLRFKLNEIEIIDPNDDIRFDTYWQKYHEICGRKGITPSIAKKDLHTNYTVIATLGVAIGDSDAVICGCSGYYRDHIHPIMGIIGIDPKYGRCGALSAIALEGQHRFENGLFISDPYINIDPNPEQLACIAKMAADNVRLFDIEPKIAFVSHSNFGASRQPQAEKMREAVEMLRADKVDFQFDGEMSADAALNAEIRHRFLPNSTLIGAANILIMPNIDSAHITLNSLKILAHGQPVGPILMGLKKSAHICPPSISVRGLLNLSSIAVAKI